MNSKLVNPLELRDAAAWRRDFEGTPGLLDFIGIRVGVAGAVAVARLLRPSLVEVRRCVLLRERFDQSRFDDWWRQLDGDIPAIEAVVNHLHLWDVFDPDPEDDLAERAVIELTQSIASSWRCMLAETYPDREFDIHVATESDDDYGPTISFSSVPGSV